MLWRPLIAGVAVAAAQVWQAELSPAATIVERTLPAATARLAGRHAKRAKQSRAAAPVSVVMVRLPQTARHDQ
jgi:hypothetical protein